MLQSGLGTAGETYVLFVFNHGAEPVDARFLVALGSPEGRGAVAGVDLVTSERVDVSVLDGRERRAEQRKRLDGGEIWVVKIGLGVE